MESKKIHNPEEYYKKAEKFSKLKNDIKALEYYLKAAEGGFLPAMLDCGRCYFEGIGTEKNTDKALEWFHKAGDLGDSSSLNNIGYIYSRTGNYEEAILWYEKAASLGDVIPMLNAANSYLYYFKDQKKAHEWLKKAESLTDAYSIRTVAEYYFQEEAMKDHINRAISLYRKAINMGDNQAYKGLGDVYFEMGNYENAHHAYQKGANAGDVDCMVDLGILVGYVPGGFEVAHYWLTKAVKLGNKYAMKVLGDLFLEQENYSKALRWYRKAFFYGVEETAEKLIETKKLIKKYPPNCKLRIRSLDNP